jgi:hypothetical protein
LKKALLATAALGAAVVVYAWLTLPPRRLALGAPTDGTIAGILHIHTNRSDGLSSPEEVAAAAARAGLTFIVLTDHGDATRTPDPPTYRSGVLCLDGVEVSTTGGHYIAIDMPASPYPLGGEPRDVVDDVRRLGGFGIAAHPDSPKPELRWTDWTAPFDAVEMLNPDTSWRVLAARPGAAPKWQLFLGLLRYPFRAPETIARLVQPTTVMEPWSAMARRRRVVMLAGADAHAKLALNNADPGDSRWALPLPGYETSFRALSVHLRPDRPLSGDAAADAAIVMRGLRNGHLYTAVDGLASPPSFTFTAANDLGTVNQGNILGAGGPIALHVQSNAPPGFATIVSDGTRVLSMVRDAQDLTVHAPAGPGVFWAAIVSNTGSPPVTWIRSNAIYVREPVETLLPDPYIVTLTRALVDPAKPARLELSKASGSIDVVGPDNGGGVRVRANLENGAATNQAVALVFDTPEGVAAYDRAFFRVRADRPMRLSAQLRSGQGATAGDRWIRSIYLDAAWREYTFLFSDFVPAGKPRTAAPVLADIRSVMLVVDLTNTKPGFAGTFNLQIAELQR